MYTLATLAQCSAGRLLVLILGTASIYSVNTHIGCMFGFQASNNELSTVEGTAFDPWYRNRMDVVLPEAGQVVLQAVHPNGSTPAPLGQRGDYRIEVAAGIYSVAFTTGRHFLPYRRAHVRVSPGTRIIVNLYPIQRTGVALTARGDVPLPDPRLLYESYHPDRTEPDLDMLIQYESRFAAPTAIKYQGQFLALTFDKLTLMTSVLILNRQMLTVEAPQETLVDLGSFRVKANRAVLDPGKHMITVFKDGAVEERSF